VSPLPLRHLITTLVGFICALPAIAQVDFNDVKDRYTLTCEPATKEQLQANLHFVDSLWAVGVSEGRMDFLYKRGFTHYMCWLTFDETQHMEKAIESFKLGWDEYQDSVALWNLVVILCFNERCEEALPLIDILEQLGDEAAHVEANELARLRTNCAAKTVNPTLE
jgi:hypothetical protein